MMLRPAPPCTNKRRTSIRPISVIVPVGGDERPPGGGFFESVFDGRPRPVDLVAAVDTAAAGDTCAAFEAAGARLRSGAGPRGRRLAEAAASSSADVLLFLHADTLLPAGWHDLVEEAVDSGAAGGAFRLAFDGGGARMAWIAFWANRRTALTRVPYGDQAPFVRRDVYERIGGHRPWPLLEDVDLGRRIRSAGRVVILPAAVRTSPRRYLEKGIVKTVLANWITLLRFRFGDSPDALARTYRS
jgi:hypothetical protein